LSLWLPFRLNGLRFQAQVYIAFSSTVVTDESCHRHYEYAVWHAQYVERTVHYIFI